MATIHESALLFLIPAFLVLIMITGRIGFFVALGGFVTAYALELLHQTEMAFFTTVGAFFALNIIQLIVGLQLTTHSMVYFCLICVNSAGVCAMVGWLALQFPFLRLDPVYLDLTIAAERLVYSAGWITSAGLVTWASLPYVGMSASPTVLMGLLMLGYYMFGTPHGSAFAKVKKTSEEIGKEPFLHEEFFICRRIDNIIQTMLVGLMPGVYYLATKHRDLHQLPQLLNLGALILAPLAFLHFISASRPIWWTGLGKDRENSLTTSFSVLAIPYLIFWAQYQSLYGPFGQYISIPPPFSFALFTLAASALAYLFYFHRSIEDVEYVSTPTRLAGYLAGAVALTAFAVLIGVPWYYLPIAAVGSWMGMSFYFNQGLLRYLVFIVSISLGFMWFYLRTISFLDYSFQLWNLSIHRVFALIWALLLQSAFIPALVASKTRPGLVAFFCTLQALYLTFIEFVLNNEKKAVNQVPTPMYPAYMVALTSLAGLWVYRKQYTSQRVSEALYWLVSSVLVGKLAILIQPSLAGVLLAIAIAALTSKAYFFRDTSKNWNARYELAFYVILGILTFGSRRSTLRSIAELLFAENPSRMFLIGFWLIVWGLLSGPVAFRKSSALFIKVVNTVILLVGLVVFFVQPEAGEALIASIGLTAFERWMAVLSVVILMSTGTGVLSISKSSTARFLVALALGFALGVVSVGLTVPFTRVGRPTKVLTFWWSTIWQSTLMIVLFTLYPVEKSPNWFPKSILPIAFTALGALFANADSTLLGLHPNEAAYFRDYMSLIGAVVLGLIATTMAQKSSSLASTVGQQSIFSKGSRANPAEVQWGWTRGGQLFGTIGSVICLSIFMLRKFSADWAIIVVAPTMWYLIGFSQLKSTASDPKRSRTSILATASTVMIYLYAVSIWSQVIWPIVVLVSSKLGRWVRLARSSTGPQDLGAIFSIHNSVEAALATLCLAVDGMLLTMWATNGLAAARGPQRWFKLDQLISTVSALGLSVLGGYNANSRPTHLLVLYGFLIAVARLAWSLRKQSKPSPTPS